MELLKPKSRAPDCNKLTWLEIEIQSQTSAWSAVNLQYGHMVLVRGQKKKTTVSQSTCKPRLHEFVDLFAEVWYVVQCFQCCFRAQHTCPQTILLATFEHEKKKMHVSLFLCMRFCSYSTVMVLCLVALGCPSSTINIFDCSKSFLL